MFKDLTYVDVTMQATEIDPDVLIHTRGFCTQCQGHPGRGTIRTMLLDRDFLNRAPGLCSEISGNEVGLFFPFPSDIIDVMYCTIYIFPLFKLNLQQVEKY